MQGQHDPVQKVIWRFSRVNWRQFAETKRSSNGGARWDWGDYQWRVSKKSKRKEENSGQR